jgi:hypothetical protein
VYMVVVSQEPSTTVTGESHVVVTLNYEFIPSQYAGSMLKTIGSSSTTYEKKYSRTDSISMVLSVSGGTIHHCNAMSSEFTTPQALPTPCSPLQSSVYLGNSSSPSSSNWTCL